MAKMLTPLRMTAVALIATASIGVGLGQVVSGDSDHAGRHKGRSEFAPFNGEGESTHCPRSKARLERYKRNVVGYYTTAFNDKDPELAVELYGGDEYIQHNPLAENGFDFVITHGLLTGAEPVFTERGSKVVDIFRLDRHGKIVEHWDVLAPISATSANGNPEV
jgi:predicted SnoaL-like aldol condensation-catalyzing enzyme